MANDFLHKINLDALKKESGLTLEAIAELSGISDAKNLGKWAQDKGKGGSRPNYNALIRLIENGVTVKTLFGVEPKEKKVLDAVPEEFDTPEFRDGVLRAIKEMKEKGLL